MRYIYDLNGTKIVITRQYIYDSTPLQFRYAFELWIKVKEENAAFAWTFGKYNHETFTKCLLAAVTRLNELRRDRNDL